MKTPEKNGLHKRHPNFMKSLTQAQKEILIKANLKGKFLGEKEKPSKEDSVESCTAEFTIEYDKLRAEANGIIQPTSNSEQAQAHLMLWQVNHNNATAKLADLQKKQEHINREKTVKEALHKPKIYFWIIPSLVLAGCIDAVFAVSSFQIFGISDKLAFFLALILGALIASSAHFGAEYVKKAVDKSDQLKRAKRILLAITVLFCVLAVIRSVQLHAMGKGLSESLLTSIAFIIINLFVFAVTAYISGRFWPSKEYFKAEAEIKALQKELQEVTSEIARIEKQIAEENKRNQEKLLQHNTLMNDATDMDIILASYEREMLVVFATSNMQYRSTPLPEMLVRLLKNKRS